MPSETQANTFGSYLKACRQGQGLSIEDIAERTKIAGHCLLAMEEDDHERLPPSAYVKSFIRAYALSVGADADGALNLYLTELRKRENDKKRWRRRQASLGTMRRTLAAGGVIVAMLVLVRYTNFFLDLSPPAPMAAPEPTTIEAVSVSTPSQTESFVSKEKSQEKLRLQILAVEDTWLKIIVDGQNARSYNLKPEDRLELEGSMYFNVMIGNATGLKILLDGKPVKIFGSSGQVVSLKIP